MNSLMWSALILLSFFFTKKIKVYPNTKPWMSKAVKSSLQKKMLSYNQGGTLDKVAKKEVKVEILKAKQRYKCKIENKLAEKNIASAWSGFKTIVGIQQSVNRANIVIDGFSSNSELANALNNFYLRFSAPFHQ